MIVLLTGTLVSVVPTRVVLDVSGVGYEMGISSTTASALPSVGTRGVTLFTRLVVRDSAIDLYGFSSDAERSVFDKLVQINGVGPKLALSVLSTFTPQSLAGIVAAKDTTRMAKVPGVGKKTASRLVMELADVFSKDPTLSTIVSDVSAGDVAQERENAIDDDVLAALLGMGFTQQEATLALEGHVKAGATTPERALTYALKRMGR